MTTTKQVDTKPRSDYFTVSDGIKIHYMQLGDAGTDVVLIHGYTGNAYGNWYANGIMQALAPNHRVTALDCRNHGRSDKPQPGGPGTAVEVLELMDHLQIDKAHIHGYSMGGAITGRILSSNPERFITAGFGGSGIREVEQEWIERVPVDKKGTDEEERRASRQLRINAAMDKGMSREEAEQSASVPPAPPPAERAASRPAWPALEIDLKSVKIPVLAINGEYDSPYAKTFRLWRELNDFTNVILAGKSHLTAIAPGYMPDEYVDSLVRFIDGNN